MIVMIMIFKTRGSASAAFIAAHIASSSIPGVQKCEGSGNVKYMIYGQKLSTMDSTSGKNLKS